MGSGILAASPALIPPRRMDRPLKCLVSTSSSFRLVITALVTCQRAIRRALVGDFQADFLDECLQATRDRSAEAWVWTLANLILLPIVN
jgi:hypothetical protein